jgi:hypothetical protein
MMEESSRNDIVELLRMRACPPEGEYLESDHGHSDCYLEREAADEIERLRSQLSQRDCWEWDCPKCGAHIYSKVLDR